MTRVPTGWSGKMWLLVCLLAIATSDDFGSMAMVSPSSELLIVADDTDTDSSTERMPACVSGSVGHTDLCSFVRKAAYAVESVNLQNVPYLQRTPRGPPDDKLHDRALSESPCFSPAAVDAAFVIVFSLLAEISLHIARNQTLGDTCPTPLAVAAKQMVSHRATSGKTGVRGGERIWAGSQLNINFCRAAGAQEEGRWEVPRCSALLRSVDSTVRTKRS